MPETHRKTLPSPNHSQGRGLPKEKIRIAQIWVPEAPRLSIEKETKTEARLTILLWSRRASLCGETLHRKRKTTTKMTAEARGKKKKEVKESLRVKERCGTTFPETGMIRDRVSSMRLDRRVEQPTTSSRPFQKEMVWYSSERSTWSPSPSPTDWLLADVFIGGLCYYYECNTWRKQERTTWNSIKRLGSTYSN